MTYPRMIPFDAQVAAHRRALHVHCYRMTGSFADAEDIVQDTMLRAWNAKSSYDAATGETGLRRWLYRIATNACLDFLRAKHRVAPSRAFSEVPWIQPYPDVLLDELPAADRAPDAEAASKETIALGYLVLIQLLPANQRAVFVLREVLGWSAAETAEALDLTVAAANSALQRARETMTRQADPLGAATAPTEAERAVLAAFIDAHQRGDVAASVALMTKDIRVTMPPHPMCFDGRDALEPLLVRAFVTHPDGEWRLVPTRANRMPAAICYLKKPGDTAFRAFKIDVVRVRDGLIAEITTFDASLVAAFGAPQILEVQS